MSKLLEFMIVISLFFSFMAFTSAENSNSITLIEQQDRMVECNPGKDPVYNRKISPFTGRKSSESFQPVLVELYNENGGVFATAPTGINSASMIYEYLTSTRGTTGICALFQDELPGRVGPLGSASVGGLMVQSEWNCGYVYHSLPVKPDGSLTDLGYSIQSWQQANGLTNGINIFPADVSSVKPWKKYFYTDPEIIISENQFADVSGIKSMLESNGNKPSCLPYRFLKKSECKSEIPVSEIDIRTASRTYSSGFVYDSNSQSYARWVGEANQYGDIEADEQLHVSNVIVQRVNYSVSDGNMSPDLIGKGNADIFMLGRYIEGYWERKNASDHTRFYDDEGTPVELYPGTTYVLLLSNSTSVVIINY